VQIKGTQLRLQVSRLRDARARINLWNERAPSAERHGRIIDLALSGWRMRKRFAAAALCARGRPARRTRASIKI
jgi:hypothetical protein